MEKHRATIGVFGIPEGRNGRGLWSVRADGKGINAIGGRVDPEDVANGLSLQDVLVREFREETGTQIIVTDDRPLGVFPTAGLDDLAILFKVKIVSGKLKPTDETLEYIWMDPIGIKKAAERYDGGDHARGLVSGTGKRQWKMAKAFFLDSSNPAYRLMASDLLR